MDRREFLKLSAIAATVPAFGGAFAQSSAGSKGDSASVGSLFKVKPHVQLLAEGTVGIVWITHKPSTGYVTWSQDGWATSNRAWSEEDGLLSANTTIHRATVDGFDPAKPLEFKAHSRAFGLFGPYKVNYDGAEEIQGGTIRPTRSGDGGISWAMFNDVHENLKIYDVFAPYLSDVNGFCVFNGDILNHIDDSADIVDRLLEPLARVSGKAQIPVWYLRGNHETRGGYARNLRDYLALKDGNYYGAVTLGGVRFAFLDCGEDKPDAHKAYSGLVDFDSYIARQNAWLEKEVASPEWKNAKARIALRHIPGPCSGFAPGLKRLDKMDAILKKADVTLAIGAHLHRWGYEAPTARRPYPLVIGGGCGLGKPQSKGNATLVKCSCKGSSIAVKILDQTGKTVVSESIGI